VPGYGDCYGTVPCSGSTAADTKFFDETADLRRELPARGLSRVNLHVDMMSILKKSPNLSKRSMISWTRSVKKCPVMLTAKEEGDSGAGGKLVVAEQGGHDGISGRFVCFDGMPLLP